MTTTPDNRDVLILLGRIDERTANTAQELALLKKQLTGDDGNSGVVGRVSVLEHDRTTRRATTSLLGLCAGAAGTLIMSGINFLWKHNQ